MIEVLQIYINCKDENANDIRIYEVGDKVNQSTKCYWKKSFRCPEPKSKLNYINTKCLNILSRGDIDKLKNQNCTMMEFEKLLNQYNIVGINNTEEISLYINLDLNEDKELIGDFIQYLVHLWRIRMHIQIKKLQERLVNGSYIEDDLIKSIE